MPDFGGASLSVLDDELFCGIGRRRLACATARCVNVEDVCSKTRVHRLEVPKDVRHVKLQDLWDEHLRSVRHTDQRQCCRASDGHYEQHLIDQESPFLFIVLVRRVPQDLRKRDAAVSFPRHIHWMRSGSYVCVGVLHHEGEGDSKHSGGHFTATCRTSVRNAYPYHYFDDDKHSVPRKWKDLEGRDQRRSACAFLYAREDLRTGARLCSAEALPFKVGQETRQFLESLASRC